MVALLQLQQFSLLSMRQLLLPLRALAATYKLLLLLLLLLLELEYVLMRALLTAIHHTSMA